MTRQLVIFRAFFFIYPPPPPPDPKSEKQFPVNQLIKNSSLMESIHKRLMGDYFCHTVSFIINAFKKSPNFPFNG